MTRKFVYYTIFFSLLCQCSDASNSELNLHKKLAHIASSLNSLNRKEISACCTKKGLKSLLMWSDSLRDEVFIQNLSKNLSSNRLLYSKGNGPAYHLFIENKISSPDVVTGELTIIISNKKTKIDEFQGETNVRLVN